MTYVSRNGKTIWTVGGSDTGGDDDMWCIRKITSMKDGLLVINLRERFPSPERARKFLSQRARYNGWTPLKEIDL